MEANSLNELVGARSANAVRRHAKRLGAEVYIGSDFIHLRDDMGVVAEIHRDTDGRWIIATWDERKCQYAAHSETAAKDPSYRYTSGRTLRSLRDLGVRSYESPSAALRTIGAED